MIIVFVLLIVIVILFSLDKFPPDSIILISLIILVLTRVITPAQAFAGFGSDFIIMLSSIFIISASLQHNGVVEFFSNKLAANQNRSYALTVSVIMIAVGLLSAFMNNTTVAAVMVLPILGMGKKNNTSPSKFLMPMAFASLIGGTCTLVGTSTNIAGSNFLQENGFAPIGMFEFLPIGIILLLFCTIFFAVLGHKLLPSTNTNSLDSNKNERLFSSHFKTSEIPSLIGKSFGSLSESGLNFIQYEDEKGYTYSDPAHIIKKHDTIYFQATTENIKRFYKTNSNSERLIKDGEHKTEVIEIMVLPSSFIVNSTILESNFQEKTGLDPIGIFRKGQTFSTNIADVKIKTGDILIAEGSKDEIALVRERNNFIVLNQEIKSKIPDLKKGFISLGIFVLAVIAGSTGLLPLSISFLSAVLLAMSFKVLPTDIVYSKVDWRLIILIGGMTAFGTAIKQTEADIYVAQIISQLLTGTSHLVVLFAFMVLTVLLTQPMSNAAAALVILPIAIQTASKIGADPRTFAISIILSASVSMITPFEPASLLVLGPGKYKISDFFKIGGILTIISLVIILFMINLLYRI